MIKILKFLKKVEMEKEEKINFNTFSTISQKRGAIAIESTIKYDYWEIAQDPTPLIKNNIFKVYRGQKPLDLIAYCECTNFAISERVKLLLEENKISGWSCYPIKIDKVEENYYSFQITGIGGEITNREKDGCVPMFKPIKWDEKGWDGSDIFRLKDSGVKVCTEKVKDLFDKAKITNIIFNDTYSKLA
jgi:hypothetical protein